MFHPVDQPLERGWVGRIDGPHVVQLAAQTLQSFFTGGGKAREHAVYPLEAVRLLAPVLHPPAVRIFEDESTFEFANPAAIVGPGAIVPRPTCNDQLQGWLVVRPRVAAVIGIEGQIGGFTILAEWRDPGCTPPKDRDFALVLGPTVLTPDDVDLDAVEVAVRVDGQERWRGQAPRFDWREACELAGTGTVLYPGDILAGPAAASIDVGSGALEVEVGPVGVLSQTVEAQA